MTIKEVTLACAKCVQTLSEKLGAMGTAITESKKAVVFSIETRLSRLEFVLTVKNTMMCPPGTLFVRVFPRKNHPLSLHLYELMEPDDFRCTYFPYNESPERVQESFSVLSALLEAHLPTVEHLALDGEAYEAALREKCARLTKVSSVNTDEMAKVATQEEIQEFLLAEWGEFYETFFQLLPFTLDDAYAAFVAGKTEKALKKYRKRAEKGQLEPYFVRLYAFLATPAAKEYAALPPSHAAAYLQGRQQQYGTREDGAFLATAGVCYGVLLCLFLLLAWIVYGVAAAGTAYMPFDWMITLILPMLPSVFGAMSLRRWLRPKLFRKDARRWLAVDAMENSKKTNGVCHVLFGLLTAVCVFFMVVFTLAVPRFYTDRMVYDDAAKFPFLNPVTYAYEDIERVCYIEGRWNVYDELVERGSYVLFFEDGRVVDLDAVLTEEQTVQRVLPLLESYMDEEVERFASDRELAEAYNLPDENLIAW